MALTQINKAGLDELALDHVFTIGASGSSAYTFQGEGLNGTVNNPTLYLTRGKTYRFENGSGGHPIRIQSTSGASGTAYNTGVTNNAGNGTVIVEVQHDAPDVLYYQCTSHPAMNGILYITGALADGGVTTAKIAADAVTTAKLADNAVGTANIVDSAVTTNKINDGSVTGAKIANDTVTNGKLAVNSVSVTKLADNAVNTAKIQDGVVTGVKIASGAVSLNKLATDSVGTAKIIDASVTLAKLEHGTSSNDGKFLRANNGADPTFETVTGTTINNNADNRVITGSGTANTLNAESGVVIDSGGNVMIGTTTTGFGTYGDDFTIERSGHSGMTIRSGAGYKGNLYFSDGTSGNAEYRGGVQYDHSDDSLRLSTSAANRVRIDSDGIKFGSDTAANNALDDFEKGAWTPRIGPDGNNSVYESGEGTYMKVGDKVTCYYAFRAKNPNSFGSTIIRIWNLPYTIRHASNHNSAHDYGSCEMMHNITFNYNGKTYFYTENNSSEIIGLESRTGTSWQNWSGSNFSNNFYLHGHITYFINNY